MKPQPDAPTEALSTRERILNAAEQTFAEQSYEGATLREIANLVGIREPSLYAHFAGKEALYGAVIDRALKPFSDEMASWGRSAFGVQQLLDIPRRLMQLHSHHPYAAHLLHREFSSPAARIHPKVLAWQEGFVEQSRAFMENLPDHAADPLTKTRVVANMVMLTHLILGCFSSAGMHQLLLAEDYEREALFEEQVRLVTRIFKSLVL